MGIGGIGVSAIAEILLEKGYRVTGSDVADNNNIARLKGLGANIVLGHRQSNIQNADLAIYSSAISQDNPEFIAAKNAGLPLYQRGRFLAELMQNYYNIAVAGAHGKTTTSGMIAHALLLGGLDPTFTIGGMVNTLDRPSRLGKSNYFIAEADESDASFLFMNPKVGIVTNIDSDHLQTYGGNFDRLRKTFVDFLQKIPADGTAILCVDDPILRSLIPQLKCHVLTYGFSEDADFSAQNFTQKGLKSAFTVKRPDAKKKLSVVLTIPGQHNVLNALATTAVAHILQIKDESLLRSFANFPGMGRRFHYHGEMPVYNGHASLVEDYGHHPNEIKATLNTAREVWPNRRVILVFQPHRYTRTRDLMDEFIDVLAEADILILLEIYGANEKPIAGIDSQSLCHAVNKISKNRPIYVPTLDKLPEVLEEITQNKDIVILQGAGNIGAVATKLMKKNESHTI